jgi:hypothetical protein
MSNYTNDKTARTTSLFQTVYSYSRLGFAGLSPMNRGRNSTERHHDKFQDSDGQRYGSTSSNRTAPLRSAPPLVPATRFLLRW